MSHRIGSVVTQSPAFVVGPGSGMGPTGPGIWERTFSPPPHPDGTKFLILHFTGASFGAGDRLEVVRSADPDPFHAMDVFAATDGASFWSRPIAGSSVVVRFVDGGDSTGQVSITEYGRGEGIRNSGNTADDGNANGDVFMLDATWDDPAFFNVAGICPIGSNPSWENVAALPAGTMRETARRVGLFIIADGDHLSTCTATVIAPDLILTASHCVATDDEARTGSFTLDFQTDAAGNRPGGYNPRFYKLARVARSGFSRQAGDVRPGRDYTILQVAVSPVGLGVAPAPMRTSLPSPGDEVFVVHHPRGTAKKVSRRPADPMAAVGGIEADERGTIVLHNCDVDNGSSGSSLFDATGHITAVNNWAPSPCNGESLSIIDVQQDFLTEPPPPKDVDVMIVFDRSGSMSLPSHTAGMTKIEHARRATALFVDLIRKDRTHRVGLVTFSTTATSPPGFVGPQAATGANETTLVGPPPHDSGIVGGITSGGTTTIGGGLQLAQSQLPALSPAANAPAILLLTDGLQNTPPMIGDVEASLGGTQLCVLGFGTEASLDGALLTRLARDHRGIYTRAEDGLSLRKFFVLGFGNIFESGISMDPLHELPAGAVEADPIELRVCGESRLTVVLGWERPVSRLRLTLVTPGGTELTASTPGLVASSGDTWTFLRLPLPFGGERDGSWQIKVSRAGSDPELAAPLPAERFFIASVIDGGPYLRPFATRRRYYTGDTINPLVELRDPTGRHVHAEVTLEVESPRDGTGNVLARSGLRPSREVDGDVLDARASTLTALEAERDGPIIATTTRTFELFDDGEHDDGAIEPDGIFGNPLAELTASEGNYTFRAVAKFGDGCIATRESFWSAQVDVGIDPGATTVTTTVLGAARDGRRQVRMTVTPRDAFGNYLGPGRMGQFEVAPTPGSELAGALVDLGDGSYAHDVLWEPGSGPAGVIITQPERPPLLVSAPAAPTGRWLIWLLLLLIFVLLAIVLWLLAS
jgi:Trypsin-like peptidase domain/von Willebrand factor type A domain